MTRRVVVGCVLIVVVLAVIVGTTEGRYVGDLQREAAAWRDSADAERERRVADSIAYEAAKTAWRRDTLRVIRVVRMADSVRRPALALADTLEAISQLAPSSSQIGSTDSACRAIVARSAEQIRHLVAVNDSLRTVLVLREVDARQTIASGEATMRSLRSELAFTTAEVEAKTREIDMLHEKPARWRRILSAGKLIVVGFGAGVVYGATR